MQKVEIKLEILTPMFSYGDNPKKSEFRITELKSLMRNTFRELYYFNNLNDMKKKEGDLFGNTEKKSVVNFVVRTHDLMEREIEMLPHKVKDKCKANCIYISSEVTLVLIAKDNIDMSIYIVLMIQASILGSLGKRSRKGFGSFKVVTVNGTDYIEYRKYNDLLNKNPIDILRECNNYLEGNIGGLYKIRGNKYDKTGVESLTFSDVNKDLDYPYIKRIYVIKIENKEDYMNLIKSISQLTHDRVHGKNGQDFIEGIFAKEKIKKDILGNCENKSRFASPVYVSFWGNDIDKYMIIKKLNYDYILDKLNIKSEGAKKANNAYIEKYIDELIKIGEGKR